MIVAEGLARSFGGRRAVRDVSFTVAPGEVVGLLGPNGAGKTTTMRCLLGLLRPSAGRAAIDGRPVGYLPESFVAYDALTVAGYLRFMARAKRLPRAEVDRAVERAGLAGLEGRPTARLSRGQRQRLGWAQAVLGQPAACVLDEPTQGLDPQQVVEARRLARSLAEEGAAVLVSTHLLAEAAQVCDRVVVLVKGRVAAVEVPGEAHDLEDRFLRLVAEGELAASAADRDP